MPDAPFVALLRRGWRAACILIAATALVGAVGAAPASVSPEESAAALERRVTRVAEQLRCLVCQNQSIADSHAQLAMDLKKLVREQMAQGRSEQEVIDFTVQRYGDFVLYRPPLKARTWLLWFGPFALLALGLGVLLRNVRRHGLAGQLDPVADDDLLPRGY